MRPIPDNLGSIDDLIKRYEAAKKRFDHWRSNLQECFEYAIPQRETFFSYTPGQKKNTHIFDSTAVIGVQKYANRLQATLMPSWRKWSILAPGSDIPKAEHASIQTELDKITEIVFDHINHSNFATQVHEAILDLSVSTGHLILEENDLAADSLLTFNAAPTPDVFPEEGPNGTIESQWRQHKLPARNVKRVWPGADLSEKMQRMLTDKPDEDVTLIEGTLYEPKAGIYHQVIIDEGEKHLVYTQSYEVSPWISFRESVVPGEVLGRGRVMQILPDIKTANKVVEFTLQNAALAIAGVYTGTDDGSINPYTMRIAPKTVIPVRSNDSSNPSLRALERSGDFNISELVLEDMRGRINKALFAEPFGDLDQPVKSATEMAMRGQELVQDAGSSFGRLQTELVEKVIKRSVYILKRAGKIPDFRVDGKEVTIKHTSPLARAQDMEELLAMQQYTETVSAYGPEVLLAGTKVEDVPQEVGKRLGIPQTLIRNEEERQQVMQLVAQMIAASQQGANV